MNQLFKGLLIMLCGVIASYADAIALSIIGYMFIGSGFVIVLNGVQDG